MNTDPLNDFDVLSAAEAAHWLGVSVATLMELEFAGSIPAPRTLGPVTWSERDFIDWKSAGCPARKD